MKISGFIAAVAALFFSAGVASAANVSSSVSIASDPASISAPALADLNLQNGIAAGKSLLALYNQYKSTGKLDLTNTTNLTNIVSLVNNIKGLTSKSTVSTTPADFISGLISGSSNLVTNNNSGSVLSALGSIAGLDADAIKKSAASVAADAATSAATNAIGKLFGKSSSSSTASSTTDSAASKVTSVLTGLFSKLN